MSGHNLLGVRVDAVEPDEARDRVLHAARACQPLSVTALAVHGVMSAVRDPELRAQVNRIDLVCPDGQPVRWGLNLLHRTRLRERVYGPALMRALCDAAAREGLPIYLYGSTAATLDALAARLCERAPGLVIAGRRPSRFAPIDAAAQDELAADIRASGARMVFVGLGCPRQEQFVWAMRARLSVPVIAVGAAFDFNAGLAPEAPAWMMRCGLQWLHRLACEPRRLWRRYVVLNPWYVSALVAQRLRVWRPATTLPEPSPSVVPG